MLKFIVKLIRFVVANVSGAITEVKKNEIKFNDFEKQVQNNFSKIQSQTSERINEIRKSIDKSNL